MKTFFALVLFCTLIVPAFSSDRLNESGNAFLHACSVVEQTDGEKDNSDVQMGFVCGAYVRGFVEGVNYGTAWAGGVSKTKIRQPYCLPEGELDSTQLVRVVLKHIRNNPESAHLAMWMQIPAALDKAFPCSKK